MSGVDASTSGKTAEANRACTETTQTPRKVPAFNVLGWRRRPGWSKVRDRTVRNIFQAVRIRIQSSARFAFRSAGRFSMRRGCHGFRDVSARKLRRLSIANFRHRFFHPETEALIPRPARDNRRYTECEARQYEWRIQNEGCIKPQELAMDALSVRTSGPNQQKRHGNHEYSSVNIHRHLSGSVRRNTPIRSFFRRPRNHREEVGRRPGVRKFLTPCPRCGNPQILYYLL
jgi:hypothetical protein